MSEVACHFRRKRGISTKVSVTSTKPLLFSLTRRATCPASSAANLLPVFSLHTYFQSCCRIAVGIWKLTPWDSKLRYYREHTISQHRLHLCGKIWNDGSFCNATRPHPKEIKKHLKTRVHLSPADQQSSCQFCQKTFPREDHCRKHMRNHHRLVPPE